MQIINRAALAVTGALLAAPAFAQAATPAEAISNLTGQTTSWGGVAVAVILGMTGFAIVRKLLRTAK